MHLDTDKRKKGVVKEKNSIIIEYKEKSVSSFGRFALITFYVAKKILLLTLNEDE